MPVSVCKDQPSKRALVTASPALAKAGNCQLHKPSWVEPSAGARRPRPSGPRRTPTPRSLTRSAREACRWRRGCSGRLRCAPLLGHRPLHSGGSGPRKLGFPRGQPSEARGFLPNRSVKGIAQPSVAHCRRGAAPSAAARPAVRGLGAPPGLGGQGAAAECGAGRARQLPGRNVFTAHPRLRATP